MKKLKIIYILFLAAAFILCTCNDPVFYAISREVKPIEPRIKGVPTNFVIFNGRMYVASGNTLYTYYKNEDKNSWGTEIQPGGNIIQIASTNEGDNLYALCSTNRNNDGKTVIKRFDKDNSTWNTLSGVENYSKVHNIFAAGDKLFIMVTSPTTTSSSIHYKILYIENNNPETINILKITEQDYQDDTGEINGAAFNGESYFLSYSSKKKYDDKKIYSGVYIIGDINEGASLIESDIRFSGIINLEDDNNTILLVARNGEVYTVTDAITKVEFVSMGKMATGALAIWRESDLPGSGRLLLSGRQDSLVYSVSYGYTYGYLELELDENGIKSGANFVEPGKTLLSTVSYDGNERYQSTIGKYPVNHLFQVPSDIDSNMTLFASTQKNGVWSYRYRNGEFQWNAEGENEP